LCICFKIKIFIGEDRTQLKQENEDITQHINVQVKFPVYTGGCRSSQAVHDQRQGIKMQSGDLKPGQGLGTESLENHLLFFPKGRGKKDKYCINL
jgi:hypothetical protein